MDLKSHVLLHFARFLNLLFDFRPNFYFELLPNLLFESWSQFLRQHCFLAIMIFKKALRAYGFTLLGEIFLIFLLELLLYGSHLIFEGLLNLTFHFFLGLQKIELHLLPLLLELFVDLAFEFVFEFLFKLLYLVVFELLDKCCDFIVVSGFQFLIELKPYIPPQLLNIRLLFLRLRISFYKILRIRENQICLVSTLCLAIWINICLRKNIKSEGRHSAMMNYFILLSWRNFISVNHLNFLSIFRLKNIVLLRWVVCACYWFSSSVIIS